MQQNDSGDGASPRGGNSMQDQQNIVMPGQAPGQEAQMSDQVNADGFVIISNNQQQPPVEGEAGISGDGEHGEGDLNEAEVAARPLFGPSASKILAPMVNVQTKTSAAAGVPQNFDTHVVLMKGITWSRDSHGLFDYESRHLTKKTLKASFAAMIMRSGNELSLIHYDDKRSFQEQLGAAKKLPEDMAMLKIVNHNKNTFYLESAAYQHHQTDLEHFEANGKTEESMYLVVRSLKINNEKIDYEIQERDILKIGRVKFAVKEIGYANQQMDVDTQSKEEKGHSANSIFTDTNEEDFEEFIQVPATMKDMSEEDPERRCRFCWGSEASKENPLLGTCKCAGSVGQIHYSCLSAWLQTRQQQKLSANFSTYFWKAFECEICKTAYPLMMKAENESYNLVKYDKPQGDYMVLESLSQEKNTSRIIHIIRPSPNKTIFKLGRGHESDLRINDISVSRCHTKIKFERGKFLLEDNQSKFGTLVLVKQRTPLLPGFNKAVQVGRTVINFSVKHLQKPDSSSAATVENGAEVIEQIQPTEAVVSTNVQLAPALPSASSNIPARMARRASEREMPSAEEQFAAQMGADAPVAQIQQPPLQTQNTQVTSQTTAQMASTNDYASEFAQIASYPEDVQLQMALQASMQMASAGQAQGSMGDQDSVNNGANDADE